MSIRCPKCLEKVEAEDLLEVADCDSTGCPNPADRIISKFEWIGALGNRLVVVYHPVCEDHDVSIESPRQESA